MTFRGFRIFRATNADGSLDPQAKFVFEPSIDSDELFDALRVEYPGIKTHAERKRQAVMDFLVREREDDMRALDMLVGNEQVASPTVMTSAASNFTPAPSSAEPTPESNASPGQPSPIELPPSAMFKSSKSSSAFQVWDPSSNKPVKLHSRRRMTEQEKEEYRMRRLLGSCDSCKQKRRKCRHFLESSPPSKPRSRKAKASRTASSSNASPLVNMHSASESGSDSSPSESLTQTFSHDMSAPPSAVFNNDDLFPISEIPFDQSFGSDFTLFSEAATDLDLLPMTEQPLFTTPPPILNSPITHNQFHTNNADWSFVNNNGGLFDVNTDWLNAPIDVTFDNFSHAVSNDLQRMDSGGLGGNAHQRNVLNPQYQASSNDWNSLLQDQIPTQSGLLARPQVEAVLASPSTQGELINTERPLFAQQQEQRESRAVLISGRLKSQHSDAFTGPIMQTFTDDDIDIMQDRASPGTILSSPSVSPSTSQYSDVVDKGMVSLTQTYGQVMETPQPVPHVPRKRKPEDSQERTSLEQSNQNGHTVRLHNPPALPLVRPGHPSSTSTRTGDQLIPHVVESYGLAGGSSIQDGFFYPRPGDQIHSSSSPATSASAASSQASSPLLEPVGVVLASSSLHQASSSRASDQAGTARSNPSSYASAMLQQAPNPDGQFRWAAFQSASHATGAQRSLPTATQNAAVSPASQPQIQPSLAPAATISSSAASAAAILSNELGSGATQPSSSFLHEASSISSSQLSSSQTLISLSSSRDGTSQLSFTGPSWLALTLSILLIVSYIAVKLGFPMATASAVGVMMKGKASTVIGQGLLLGLVAMGGDMFVGPRTGCSGFT